MEKPMETTHSPATPVSVTAAAAKRIGEVLAKAPAGSVLRVSVSGGGCSGFQYMFDVAEHGEPDDLTITRDGATVVVDPVSLPFLDGATVDYIDDLMGASFRIENPNATASCGCGTSFSI